MMQPQNVVINQMPIQHTIMTTANANSGIPIATALVHQPAGVEQQGEMKPMVVETIPIAQANIVSVPGVPNIQTVQNVQTVPIQSQTISAAPKPVQQTPSSTETQTQVLTKQRLQDLVRDTDSTLTLEDEVEEIILQYVDEFVERCLNGAALIAKNRQVSTVEVKDVQQFLNRNYNMWTPGLGTAELRPYKRSLTTEAHKQRLALIRKTLKKY